MDSGIVVVRLGIGCKTGYLVVGVVWLGAVAVVVVRDRDLPGSRGRRLGS